MAVSRNKPLCAEYNVPSDQCAALHRQSTASSIATEIGHAVARKLKYWDGPPYNIPEIVDKELQEVRNVLEELRNNHGCWCPAGEDYTFQPPFVCGEACLRTRSLFQRLQVKE